MKRAICPECNWPSGTHAGNCPDAPDLPMECTECGERDDQVALIWADGSWLCPQCSELVENMRDDESGQDGMGVLLW